MHVYNELFGKPVERQGRKAKVSKRLFRMIDRLHAFTGCSRFFDSIAYGAAKGDDPCYEPGSERRKKISYLHS